MPAWSVSREFSMRTIRLEPLTRVEGHGRVELLLEKDHLREVRLAITESPRLFEGLVLGRSFREVPALVCRICAICSSVHRVAAAGALEKALKIETPEAARWVRELLLLGGHIESHALHLFCLVYPDIAGVESVVELLRRDREDPIANAGLQLKALGNRLQTVAGGRTIHPVNIEVGGVLKLPDRAQLEELEEDLARWEESLPSLLSVFSTPGSYPPSESVRGVHLSVSPSVGLTLQGESLALSDGRTVNGEKYKDLLEERPVSYSNARQSGTGEEFFLAGALARRENAVKAGVLAAGSGNRLLGIYENNAAQGDELIAAVKRARQLTGKILGVDPSIPLWVEPRPGPGIGTTVVEAPRGLLIHQYALDDMGRVAAADIVTPTAINQRAVEQQLFADLQSVTSPTELSNRAQQIVRAFDPCISCSVHLLQIGEFSQGP